MDTRRLLKLTSSLLSTEGQWLLCGNTQTYNILTKIKIPVGSLTSIALITCSLQSSSSVTVTAQTATWENSDRLFIFFTKV